MKIIISYLALIENNDNCLSKTGENSKLLHKRRYTTNLTRLTATTKCITYIRKNLKVKNAYNFFFESVNCFADIVKMGKNCTMTNLHELDC